MITKETYNLLQAGSVVHLRGERVQLERVYEDGDARQFSYYPINTRRAGGTIDPSDRTAITLNPARPNPAIVAWLQRGGSLSPVALAKLIAVTQREIARGGLTDQQIENAIEGILKTASIHTSNFGVECLESDRKQITDYYWRHAFAYYVNSGDTYAATLICRIPSFRFSIGCWGDLVETYPGYFS